MGKNAVSLSEENFQSIKKQATKRGSSMSAILNEIVASVFLEDVKPVVLQVPKELIKKNKDGLESWLRDRSDRLLKYWYPK